MVQLQTRKTKDELKLNKSTTTKKRTADPLPLLPFTYAFCMVVNSMIFMIMMAMEMKVVILYIFLYFILFSDGWVIFADLPAIVYQINRSAQI